MFKMESLIGNTVVDAEGNTHRVHDLCKPGTLIGLLFAWSLSIPCQLQIPHIVDYYKLWGEKYGNREKKFEIILIDEEKTRQEWSSYCKTMPWLAVPYQSISSIRKNFEGVRGYPTLQLYDSVNGKLLSADITDDILNNREIIHTIS